jgi:hypothetical protein
MLKAPSVNTMILLDLGLGKVLNGESTELSLQIKPSTDFASPLHTLALQDLIAHPLIQGAVDEVPDIVVIVLPLN